MSVYVDEAVWPYGRMVMCHMIADTDDELHAMADKLGVSRRWHQKSNYSHYDICKSKRAMAVSMGAIEIGRREFVDMAKQKRNRENTNTNNRRCC